MHSADDDSSALDQQGTQKDLNLFLYAIIGLYTLECVCGFKGDLAAGMFPGPGETINVVSFTLKPQ